jgi:DNA-binding SARP family transcriptional activator
LAVNYGLVTFGGMVVTRNGEPYEEAPIQRRQLALLVLIASAGAAGMSRDRLVEHFWPDRDVEHGRNLLDQALSSARRAFGTEVIHTMATTVAVNAAMLTIDRTAFDQAVRDQYWGRAVSLYVGPFLDGVVIQRAPVFGLWVDNERTRCQRQFADALEALAVEADRVGRSTEALRWWKRLVETDPLSARATTGYMLALTNAGERATALEFARVYDSRVSQALGAAPDPAVGVLADALRRGSLPRPPLPSMPVQVNVPHKPLMQRWVSVTLILLLAIAVVWAIVLLVEPGPTT